MLFNLNMAEIIKSLRSVFLHLDGYLYYKHSEAIGKTAYWNCRKKGECSARAITTGPAENLIIKKKQLDEDHSSHAPNIEEVKALKIVNKLKRKAVENPEQPPAQILRTELQNVSSEILAEMPDRLSLRKGIGRERI